MELLAQLDELGIGAIAKIVSITVALTAPLSSLLTLYLTKGTEAWRIRFTERSRVKMAEKQYEDNIANAAHELVVRQFESRLASQEGEIKTLRDEIATSRKEHARELTELYAKLEESRKEHANCLIEQEKLRGDLKALQVHVDRLWAHDQANRQQIKKNLEAVMQVNPEVEQSPPPEYPRPIDAEETEYADRGEGGFDKPPC